VELVVARIGRPHGVKGEVTVQVRTDSPEVRFALGKRLTTDRENPSELVIASSRLHAGTWLLTFQGIVDRNQAEELRGVMLSADIDLEEGSEDGSFHVAQLIGSQVIHRGASLGLVDEVLSLPGQDLLSIKSDDGERLIPMVKEFIVEINRTTKTITVELPEGMLD